MKQEIYENEVNNMEELLTENEKHYQIFIKKPFFSMIRSGLLNTDEEKREVFFNHVQIFSDYFQTMMMARQATCHDGKFYTTFLKHFMEELGHDELLRQRKKLKQSWDPVIVAICTWFVYQMQVLDNIEKAVIMHLVLEKTGDYYHSLGQRHLQKFMKSNYYEIHAEHDASHADMIMDLLPGYPSFTYQRLMELLKQSWQMMYTMVDRVYDVVIRGA